MNARPSVPDAILDFLKVGPASSLQLVLSCSCGYDNPRVVMRALCYLKARGKVHRVDPHPPIPGRGNYTRWALTKESK